MRNTTPYKSRIFAAILLGCSLQLPSAMAQGVKYVTKAFDSYRITYAITNPYGKDYARIDYFSGANKVGQMLFGSAITPGSYAAIVGGEIDLYFPLSHFDNIQGLLRHEKNLVLYVEFDPTGNPSIGGLTNQQRQRIRTAGTDRKTRGKHDVQFKDFTFTNSNGIDATVTLEAPIGTAVGTYTVPANTTKSFQVNLNNVSSARVTATDGTPDHTDKQQFTLTGNPYPVYIEDLSATWIIGSINGEIAAGY